MKFWSHLPLGALLAGSLSSMAFAEDSAPNVPDALKVPAGHVLKLVVKAEGFQIYTCSTDKTDQANFVWNLAGPEADLFDAQGKKLGRHYVGPTWESMDGSKVVGQVKASDKGPDANAISWLLLEAKSNTGEGVMGHITHVQRVATVGGKAPAGGCTAETKGTVNKAPYSAKYYFYEAAK